MAVNDAIGKKIVEAEIVHQRWREYCKELTSEEDVNVEIDV